MLVSCHWGTEYSSKLNDQQREIAPQLLADSNIDLVIGHHAHVVQPMEKHVTPDGRETFVIFSMGNFVSGQSTVDQRSTSNARQRFSDSVLRRSVAAVKNYWQQRIFSGRDLPPPELESDEAVVSYVVNHRGALGYVSGSAKLDKAKPVAVP